MILFGSNADTELLAMRTISEDLPEELGGIRWFHSDRMEEVPNLDEVKLVIVRMLGGMNAYGAANFAKLRAACVEAEVPLVAAGGEDLPDAAMTAASTVPAGVAKEVHRYLSAGGPGNMAQLVRFLSDTVHMTGLGFEPPTSVPDVGVWEGAGLGVPGRERDKTRPLVGVIFYRAHLVAGNTTYVESLCSAIEEAGADALPIWTYSLRKTVDGKVPALAICRESEVDVIITSTLSAGSQGAQGEGWTVPGLEDLGIPIIQSPSTGFSRAQWIDDDAGLSPFDVATGIAIPEFDGRIIAPTYAFKEVVEEGELPGDEIVATRADPERAAHVARLAIRTAALSRTAAKDRRVVIVLSAYPTNRARLGNAVGLDTPASAVRVLQALGGAGYDLSRIPDKGDQLLDELAVGLTYDSPKLSDQQIRMAAGSLPAETYTTWYDKLPEDARQGLEEVWGSAPGEVYVQEDRLHFPGIDLGNVLVTIQPPRGFGSDPIGTYHAPDLPPPHHYLAFYRWLETSIEDGGWGADAVIHLGKHGTLEWLPGKAIAPGPSCFPDAALGDLPFFYPFVVNDPGEGAQAKRRTHAVVVDHLPPPMTRADTYDDLARLEQVLDGYAQAQVMDPEKLPAMRRELWDLLVQTEIHRDLELEELDPEDEGFDDMLLHVDGYLCAIKDAMIRGGLHILGEAPSDDLLVDSVLAITRLSQGGLPSMRDVSATALGIELEGASRNDTDLIEEECRRRVELLAKESWSGESADNPTSAWVCKFLVPNLRRATDEIDHLLEGLEGKRVPAGPSGAPSRGGAHVLPTGRNFYSVDPKAIPSRLAYEVGETLAERVIERYVEETGGPPKTVGIVLWGTAAMRTSGDDVAEALAMLGVRPQWNDESQRIIGLEVIPLAELGRPRVDITLRISGFFRDAFPHVITLLDDAVRMVSELDETAEENPIQEAGIADARIWGPPPGGYGSGLMNLLEQRAWRNEDDLAEAYLAWSGFAYGRDRNGTEEPEAMRRRFAAIEVAIKNQDNREHDIFDSNDYLQDHGGMIAAVRALRGEAPKAWFGDSSDPSSPKVRSLREEAARVVRSRVLNPRWIDSMRRHGYKGAFELAATVDYLFGYDATAHVVEDWMYEKVTQAYVADPEIRAFFQESNPWALKSIAEKLLEAADRELWAIEPETRETLVKAVLEAEGWEENR